MKAHLMHRDRDLDLQGPLPANEDSLMQDLELNVLLNTMARGDRLLYDVAHRVLLKGARDLDTIRYRQDILRDALEHPAVIRDLYQIPVESEANRRKDWLGVFTRFPTGVLSSAIQLMEMYVALLKRLRQIADDQAEAFRSEGFRAFFSEVQRELDDAYFGSIEDHLRELKFGGGVLLSARLGQGNEGDDYVLRRPEGSSRGWVQDLLTRKSPSCGFSVHPRDDGGTRALADLRDNGINLVANALAQSADHISEYMRMLRVELAYYVGCLNLRETLAEMGCPIAFPVPAPVDERRHTFTGLYDVCLALTMKERIEGSDVNADSRALVIVTGANQGGKSTFLRSIGLAQLMMQCGMYVPAEAFSANLCTGLFTHYRREEDTTMQSGKLDEELGRMSALVDHMTPHAIVLFNESFAATNEREGSEIARQITETLVEKRIKVFFVTHLYEFANGFWRDQRPDVLFLRAPRKSRGRRTFRLREGEPLQTSFGRDVYDTVFGERTQEVS